MRQTSAWAAVRRCLLGVLATAAVVASFASAGAASAAATPLTPPSCSATVTNHYPKIGTSVGVKVHGLAGIRIRVIAHFKHGTAKKVGHANSAGKQTFWYRLKSDTAPGYRVDVDVAVFRDKRAAYCSTWFTPQAKHHGGGHGGGAWCTATATVYNAQYDENNVYVNSNQPYTDATASADGYSWSYETNDSGYALIYLNGPPPGAKITVTVGGATCYTSD
jgi:hypothetical protein